MPGIAVELDPSDVGLDEVRLSRISRHFARYVDDRRLPGFLVVISRGGKVAYVAAGGSRDLEASVDVEADSLWRIYSMTKPVTSVAAMICVEEGLIALDDPVHKFIPEFEATRVFTAGSSFRPVTVPQTVPMRIWNLFTHTAGLTYGFMFNHPVDAMYRSAGFELGGPPDLDLQGSCERWARLPLLFQPGSRWSYSVATDVLGRVVEVASGTPLDQFFAQRIFEPLAMGDTGFAVQEAHLDRLAVLYTPDLTTGRATRNDAMSRVSTSAPRMFSGGGGLVSSAADYHRFTQFLLRRGELDGVRLLGSRTVDFMTRNHLSGGTDLAHFGNPIAGEADAGLGFGLGFSVVIDPVEIRQACSVGSYGWGGAASTVFWVDPAEDLTAMFFTQLLPSSTYPIRRELRQLVYPAIID